MSEPWPLHTLVLAVGCSLFVLGLFDRRTWMIIAGVLIAVAELVLLH